MTIRTHEAWSLLHRLTACLLAIVLLAGMAPSALAETAETGPLEVTPGLPVQTRYAELQFPEEFADAVTILLTETVDSSVISVTTILAEQEVLLYTLILTEMDIDAEDAFLLGVLQDDGLGRISIVLQMEEQIPENWSEHELMRICELQETVNDLLIQLMEDPRFDDGAGAL